MFQKLMEEIQKWAMENDEIESVILVGSYARGTNTEASDIDFCIITTGKTEMLRDQGFVKLFGEVEKKQVEYYGNCTSVRVWYRNGMEVEFGLVEPSWAALPLDDGTYRVLSDGYQVLADKKQYFGESMTGALFAVSGTGGTTQTGKAGETRA